MSKLTWRFSKVYEESPFQGRGPPRDDLRFSNTTGILQKKKSMWFIGVEVEQETRSATPPQKNPGSAPAFRPEDARSLPEVT